VESGSVALPCDTAIVYTRAATALFPICSHLPLVDKLEDMTLTGLVIGCPKARGDCIAREGAVTSRRWGCNGCGEKVAFASL
jgi:hypothetical protein